MFFQMPAPAPDPLWSLNTAFRQDPRTDKIDLVVGVYRDETGITPSLKAVQAAERELAAEGASKAYRSLAGNIGFNAGMARLLFADAPSRLTRQHTMQTIGATGALRLLAELVARANPEATVWSTNPAYVNHKPLMEAAGLRVANYRWREREERFDLDAMLDDLAGARAGDVVLLHGCCHNPTGIDMPLEGWMAVAERCAGAGLIPLVDIAYQGFGTGLDEDAGGLRLLVDRLETVLVSASCSKNMGLYCERVGTASVVTAGTAQLRAVAGTLEQIARANYSMPAEHGAAIAAKLLADPRPWHAELDGMRMRVVHLRHRLSEALERHNLPRALADLRRHKGMFSQLPLDRGAMVRLREDFAIYGTESGRINVAGLQDAEVERVATALALVFGTAT